MNTYKPDMMIYHADCADGFGAAWAAWMRWGNDVEYVPCACGQPAPDVLGKHVLIGDFSFKHDSMELMAKGASSIVVLDHHESAQSELQPWRCLVDKENSPLKIAHVESAWSDGRIGHVMASFDMNRSGARMVWDFCHESDAPLLIRLIEDRDLWRFTMPETKPFGVWLRCEPFDFERWELIAQELNDGSDADRIFAEATAMQRFFDQKVAEIGRLARRGVIDGNEVPLCNAPPMFASEVGHWLLDENPQAPFVAIYSDQGKSRGYSLRSRDERMNVAVIAKKFGGGGHRNAAGFGVPL